MPTDTVFCTLLFALGLAVLPSVESRGQSGGNLQVLFVKRDLTCATKPDGGIEASLLGGSRPVQFVWINAPASLSGLGEWAAGQPATLALNDLPAGAYQFAFADAQGDTLTQTIVLQSPPPIDVALEVNGEACFGQNGGSILIAGITGGQAPYRAGLENEPPSGKTSWTGLPGGTYTLTVVDALGCTQTEGAILPQAPGLTFDAGPDTTIALGDTLRLEFSADRPIDSLALAPPDDVIAIGPDWVLLLPQRNRQYTVNVFAADGCGAADNLFVGVFRQRAVFFPNVFAPGGADPANRFFSVYTGSGVAAVSSLRVYNRQGKRVFNAEQMPANVAELGWDGTAAGDEQPPGVYLWEAVLRFTDGREKVYTGDVTLIR
ncbi:MAG: gliding motility-associated C-terminal domain-containing protein [Saprospiraceae bacterium]|nr:gliding motility-associated C-terminal domain-containing protein [Saprospiraceae bacterium]